VVHKYTPDYEMTFLAWWRAKANELAVKGFISDSSVTQPEPEQGATDDEVLTATTAQPVEFPTTAYPGTFPQSTCQPPDDTPAKTDIVRRNLKTLLRGSAQQWYIAQLQEEDREWLKQSVDNWKFALRRYFGLPPSQAEKLLLTILFDHQRA
jgi:hypothetical protein